MSPWIHEFPTNTGLPLVALGTTTYATANNSCVLTLHFAKYRRYGETLAPLAQTAQLLPDDIRISLARGCRYKRDAQIDLAIDALLRAPDAEPNKAILPYNLACYFVDRRISGELIQQTES